MHLHEARDVLVIDEVTTAAQLMSHTSIAIAGKLILDALDEMYHLQIAQGVAGFAGAVVERAARKPDHFAPPSDGAGFAPVTMEEFSLPLTSAGMAFF
jgi:hypothetical protein